MSIFIRSAYLLFCLPIIEAVNDIYGLKGESVVLVCPYKGYTDVERNLYWKMDYANDATLAINDRLNNNTLLYNRLSVVGNNTIGEYNLQISDIRESDEGQYTCNVAINYYSQTLYLIVSPSTLTIENVTIKDRLLGTEGQNLTVSCVAVGGKPPPSVSLTVNGTRLATDNQSVAYTLNFISRSYDSKEVVCEASNKAYVNNLEKDTAVIYLNLKPLQPIFSLDEVSIEETKPLVVSCTSTGSRPAATFQWYKDQVLIISGITTSSDYNTADDTYTVKSSLIHTIDKTYNGKTLTCSAYNNVSTSAVVTSKKINVKFAPDINVNNITYNQSMFIRTVTCIPFGNPSTYTYYRWQQKSTYGVLIRELDGGQILTLPSVPVETGYQDTGEYVCTVSNGITGIDGKVQRSGSGYVTVNAQPVLTSRNKNTEYGELKKDVDIHVYVYSVPKYTSVKWYKTNTSIAPNSKYTLSEASVIVTDTFHGTQVQLDGYRLTLTIKELLESDFSVYYTVKLLTNSAVPTAVHTVLLLPATASQASTSASAGPIIGGVAGGLGAVLIIIVILWFVIVKRKQGLQHNILYQSAGSDFKPKVREAKAGKKNQHSSTSDTEYADVQKPNVVCTEVDKTVKQKTAKDKKLKDKKKPGKKENEAWNQYQEAEYANDGLSLKEMREGEYVKAEDRNRPSTIRKNQQGLEYADLYFTKQIPNKGTKSVIRAEEDRILYSEVDHTKKAPPTPQESAYEETTFKHG